MKTIQPKWYRCALLLTVMAAIGGSSVVLAQAQKVPAPASVCARPERLLTSDDRDAIAKVFRDRIKERLGLSDQQAEQIRTTLQSRRDEARTDVQALCEARVELRRLLQQQNSESADLKAAADRVKLLQGTLLDRRLDTVVALRSLLTPDQWAKWIELRKGTGHRWIGRGRRFSS